MDLLDKNIGNYFPSLDTTLFDWVKNHLIDIVYDNAQFTIVEDLTEISLRLEWNQEWLWPKSGTYKTSAEQGEELKMAKKRKTLILWLFGCHW